MGKAIAIVGIVGAVFAALAATVLVDAAVFAIVPVALAGSIVLLAQRTAIGAIAGLAVLLLAVLATLGLMGSVTTEDGGSADFGISESTGRVLAIVACMAIPLGALAVRWDDVEPAWLAWAGVAAGVLATLLAILQRAHLADQSHLPVLAVGVLALATMAPMVGLLRAPASAS